MKHFAAHPDRYLAAVDAHQHLVYAAALRQLRNPASAEDATQAVFLVLLKKLPTLSQNRHLAPWLLTVTRYVCNDTKKRDRRRRLHEQRLAMQSTLPPTTEPNPELQHHLDDALATLSQKDRDILTLRFLQQLDIPTVAASLAITEATTYKRINRALTSLRNYFTRHRINLSATAATTLLTHAASIHAPTHLASMLTSLNATTATKGALTTSHAATNKLLLDSLKLPAAAVATLVIALSLASLGTHHPLLPAPVRLIANTTNPAPLPIAKTPSLQEIVDAWDRDAASIRDIHIKNFDTKTEIRPDGSDTWTPNVYAMKGETWFTPDESRGRIHFTSLTMDWTDGLATSATSAVDLAFDGKTGYEVNYSTAYDGKTFPDKNAKLLPTPPMLLWDRTIGYGTGRFFDILSFKTARNRLADSFRQALKSGLKLPPFQTIDTPDGPCISFHNGNNDTSATIWFDPTRNFALRKYVEIIRGKQTRFLHITKFSNPIGTHCFPLEGIYQEQSFVDIKTPAQVRYTFSAAEVETNIATNDNSLFTLTIPARYTVNDKIKNQVYRTKLSPLPATGPALQHATP